MQNSPFCTSRQTRTHTCLSSSVRGWQAWSSSIFCAHSGPLKVINAKLLQGEGEGATLAHELDSPAAGQPPLHSPSSHPVVPFDVALHHLSIRLGQLAQLLCKGVQDTAYSLPPSLPPSHPPTLAASPSVTALWSPFTYTLLRRKRRTHVHYNPYRVQHAQMGLTKSVPSGRSSPRPPASRPPLCRSAPPPPYSPARPLLHSPPAPLRVADQWIPRLLLRAWSTDGRTDGRNATANELVESAGSDRCSYRAEGRLSASSRGRT